MYKFLFLCLFSLVFFATSMIAQQVIISDSGDTTVHPSAILDIRSAGKGVIFPRTKIESVLSPTKGLVVFDTIQSSLCVYDGGNWINLSAFQDRIEDTDGDTKVIVTDTPFDDLIEFRVDGEAQWRMADHQLEPANTGGSILIGGNAGKTDDLSNNFNVSIGQSAAESNSMGNSNVTIGGFAGFNHQQGSSNTILGYAAGHNAFYPSSSVFLGHEAGYNEIFSNRLHISNSKDLPSLLYGEFDNQILRVGGQLQVRGSGNLNQDKVISMANSGGTYNRIIVRQADNDLYLGDVDATGGEVHIRANGEDWLSILPQGNVGYGISNPDNPFHIHKRTLFDRAPLKITDTETGSAVADGFDIGFQPIFDELDLTLKYRETGSIRLIPKSGFGLAVDEFGKVGIGTRNPQVDLHVTSASGNQALFLISGDEASNNEGILIGAGSDGTVAFTQLDVNSDMEFNIGATSKLMINNEGVGIGTDQFPNQEVFRVDAPFWAVAQTIAIDGSDRFLCDAIQTTIVEQAAIRDGTEPALRFERTSSDGFDGELRLTSGGDFRFMGGANGNLLNTLMSIESNGEVGIGTTNPSDIFHISAPAASNPMRVQADGTTRFRIFANGGISIGSNTQPSGANVYMANKLGMGITAPSYRIELPNSSSVGVGYGLAKGWNTYSDTRVKFDQREIQYGLKEVMKLEPKSYQHANAYFENQQLIISDKEVEQDIGLIAQEVIKVIPEVVKEPADENNALWSVEYAKMIPVLIKAIQEQQLMIDQQNEQIQQLKASIQGYLAEKR
jgi:hypothetical protein